MARNFLRGFAIAAGTGLAIGFGSAFRRAKAPARPEAPADLHRQDLEPLIERLDRMESRVAEAELRPSADLSADVAAVRASISNIEQRLEEQTRELELLRIRTAEAEKLAEAEIRLTERRFKEVAASLPAEIEAAVGTRVEQVRQRLHAEIKESVASAVAAFEDSLDSRISSRITALEHKLIDQSASLADLTHRAGLADTNLQKLVDAVERLCEKRAAEPVAAPAPAPTPQEPTILDLRFENHLQQALSEEAPATMAAAAPAAPGGGFFRPRSNRPDDDLRPRLPLAHIMIATTAALVGTHLLSGPGI